MDTSRIALALMLLEASLMSTIACDAAEPRQPGQPDHEQAHAHPYAAPELGPADQRDHAAAVNQHEHQHPTAGSQQEPASAAGQHEHATAGSHGNPADLAAYVARLESPERAAWQKPDQVVAALGLRPGMRVCEIGAGPGYFSLRLAAAVAPGGVVYAVDVEPALLAVLRKRIAAAGASVGLPAAAGKGMAQGHPAAGTARSGTMATAAAPGAPGVGAAAPPAARLIVPVLGLPDDPLVPAGTCDLALLVNTLHHMAEPAAYLRRLALALAPGGRIANIDFERRPTPMGPPLAERIGRDDVVALAAAAGLRVAAEHRFLEHQYFIELRADHAS